MAVNGTLLTSEGQCWPRRSEELGERPHPVPPADRFVETSIRVRVAVELNANLFLASGAWECVVSDRTNFHVVVGRMSAQPHGNGRTGSAS